MEDGEDKGKKNKNSDKIKVDSSFFKFYIALNIAIMSP